MLNLNGGVIVRINGELIPVKNASITFYKHGEWCASFELQKPINIIQSPFDFTIIDANNDEFIGRNAGIESWDPSYSYQSIELRGFEGLLKTGVE
ncbi:hypothetical protein DUZ99_02115 [Xylanibacillus composti]|uniref:Uncharacterized protein n=1 Tax=Xylanibacillus composti TaxID=1572762 RepID=A0A8J4GYG0_9BACL|nr:hypothetical protein [Xylanibacillus composti]MDT9723790.1 hypothetical protein [Xylanibacillus composti]GIQ67439.1 hypothetical protein XYCOK13_02630 [Xylanibacillus composti]